MHDQIAHLASHTGSAQMLFIMLAGVADCTMGGVRLHIDVEAEDSYIETQPGFEMDALVEMERLVKPLGFEVMYGMEADEELPNGGMRHWLAQTWFPVETEGEEMVA